MRQAITIKINVFFSSECDFKKRALKRNKELISSDVICF